MNTMREKEQGEENTNMNWLEKRKAKKFFKTTVNDLNYLNGLMEQFNKGEISESHFVKELDRLTKRQKKFKEDK